MSRLLVLLAVTMAVIVMPSQGDSKIYRAECTIAATSGVSTQKIQGTITFAQQEHKDVEIGVALSGFDTLDQHTEHGFHIHKEGKLGNECGDAGGHYNPGGKKHGGPDSAERHVGDLGNIEEDDNGNVKITKMTDKYVKLYGDTKVIGRSVVVHAYKDDLGTGTGDKKAGSEATGNAGPRLGCCIIKDTTSSGVATLPSLVFATLLTMAAMFLRH